MEALVHFFLFSMYVALNERPRQPSFPSNRCVSVVEVVSKTNGIKAVRGERGGPLSKPFTKKNRPLKKDKAVFDEPSFLQVLFERLLPPHDSTFDALPKADAEGRSGREGLFEMWLGVLLFVLSIAIICVIYVFSFHD